MLIGEDIAKGAGASADIEHFTCRVKLDLTCGKGVRASHATRLTAHPHCPE